MPEASRVSKKAVDAVMTTDPGRRKNNEDAPVLAFGEDIGRPGETLFGVVDGMGGYEAGEVASEIARETIQRLFAEGGDDIDDWVIEAHKAIVEDSRQNPERQGMGAVVSVAILSGDKLKIAHVGDTRIYRLRGDDFSQVTEDHSAVGELVRAGQLDKAVARTHRMSNVVLRAIGHDEKLPAPAVYNEEVEPGDLYLACSDGLTDVLTDDQVRRILLEDPDLENTAQTLIASALTDQTAVDTEGEPTTIKGGKDNISVVIVRIPRDASAKAPAPTTAKVAGNPEPSANPLPKVLKSPVPAWMLYGALLAALALALALALKSDGSPASAPDLSSENAGLMRQSTDLQQRVTTLERAWREARAFVARRDSSLAADMDSVKQRVMPAAAARTAPATPAPTPAPAESSTTQ